MNDGATETIESKVDPRAAFRYPAFVNYQFARFSIVVATEMQAVAVGWQVYEITKRPLDLGLVGLAQFLPSIVLFLISGHAADRFNRRNLLLLCDLGFAVCFALLIAITLGGSVSIVSIYAVLVLLGVVRSFNGPVSRAIFPQLVPPEVFASSVAWGSTFGKPPPFWARCWAGCCTRLRSGSSATARVPARFTAVRLPRPWPRWH
ncbi:MAG TPA: MFS transporter [Candidatus Acidoferrum sp.]|nr:MFS transporter [Candidatus Acidoferrum sp.]